MQFHVHDTRACLSAVERKQNVTSLSHHQSSLWADYIGDINHAPYFISSSTGMAFLTNTSEKQKSTSPRIIPVKNSEKLLVLKKNSTQ